MSTFWTVLKNNYRRACPRAVPLAVITLITLGSIFLAIYITGRQQVRGHIVFIQTGASQTVPKSTKELEIISAAQKPPRSDLIRQKYDAYITVNADGSMQIDTLRGDDFKKALRLLLADPGAKVAKSADQRGVGVNIVGFMMLFLLMAAFSNLFAFADDREQGQLRRVAAAPASFGGYLAAHTVYSLSMLLPDFLLLAVLRACGWDIGFSLPIYAGLMALLGFLGVSFALLLHTLIFKPDNADMLGASVNMLTSVLSGGFYSFTKKNAVMDGIAALLPQKQVLNFAQALQDGDAAAHAGAVVYAAAVAAALFAAACLVLRAKYIKTPRRAPLACQTGGAGLQ